MSAPAARLQERPPGGRADLPPLFADLAWPRPVVDAVLEGYAGEAVADTPPGRPASAAILYAQDFYVVGGDPAGPAAAGLVDELPDGQLVIANGSWYALIHQRRPRQPESWYWRTFDCSRLDAARLRHLAASAHAAYEVVPLDEELIDHAWSDVGERQPEHAFRAAADLLEHGFGYCAVRDGQVLSAAVSFARSGAAIEVQTNTHQKHRRRGLATATCAAPVLRALEEGLQPHWSAANRRSEGLAEKLGYLPEARREVLYLPR